MKFLYWLSFLLTAPFWGVAWVFYGIAWTLNHLGDTIHDLTTFRIWLILHRRKLRNTGTKDRTQI
jgi:hypothetical protein